MCKSDNDYLLSALQEQKISLSNLNYHVKFSKQEFEITPFEKDNKLDLFNYEIVILDSKQAMDDRFPALKDKDYLETYIPISEAPTSCYAFASQQKLNLICHYGHEKHKGIAAIVTYLK